VPFLSSLPLRPGRGDTLLLGLDGRPSAQGVSADGKPDFSKGKDMVERAYNDHGGVTREFIMHGLEVADAELRGLSLDEAKKRKEGRIIDLEKWEYAARYNVSMGA
jgi:L-histidine Nalpha-methyltransferase / hercynylcysteine S-oxide synthase